MQPLHALAHWIASNPGWSALIAYAADNAVVGVTPQRFQKTRWYGGLLFVAHRLSFLAHSDAIGTLQWPVIARAILLGAPDPGVAAAAAAHAASLASTSAPALVVPVDAARPRTTDPSPPPPTAIEPDPVTTRSTQPPAGANGGGRGA